MSHRIARRKLAYYLAGQLQAGSDAKELAQQTVAYLVAEKQVGQVELLIREIESQLASEFDVVTARITTARPMSDAVRTNIEAFVKAAEGARSVVIADEATDPDLIGGAVIQTPGSIFDSSIRTQLRQLTASTKE
jgi:F-type H+-transporting ATPase subunit delta